MFVRVRCTADRISVVLKNIPTVFCCDVFGKARTPAEGLDVVPFSGELAFGSEA